ncbi:MAG: HupE/UreJ family protein [Pseudomonadota bacterium]
MNRKTQAALTTLFAPLGLTVLALTVLTALPALAHDGEGAGGLVAGLLHPISGPDHVVAMIAVGLWGAILGAPALWQLPVAFPLVMALAGALAVMGVPLPGVEAGIGLSGVVLGLMVLFALRPPIWVAAGIVSVFAVFHGHAHGSELPATANPLAYAVGFVVTTGLLHLAGIAIGMLVKWPAGRVVVRASGAVIALAGGAFLGGIA